MHMPALQLNQPAVQPSDDELNDLSSEDEAVANDLDMHALILGSHHTEDEPIKSAEEVLKEIDDIMDETSSDDEEAAGEHTEAIQKAKEVLGTPLYEDSKFLDYIVELSFGFYKRFVSSQFNQSLNRLKSSDGQRKKTLIDWLMITFTI